MKGTVVFKIANERSKSECLYPYLQTEDDQFIKIRFSGDNPFENPTLREYDGKYVSLEGDFSPNGTFTVTEITELALSTAPEATENVEEDTPEVSEDTASEN